MFRVHYTLPGGPEMTCYPMHLSEDSAAAEAQLLRNVGAKTRIVRILNHEESKRKFAAEQLRKQAANIARAFVGAAVPMIVGQLQRDAEQLWPSKAKVRS